jgi:hypothetical protein
VVTQGKPKRTPKPTGSKENPTVNRKHV